MKTLLKAMIFLSAVAVAIALVTDRENDKYRKLYKHYVKLDLDQDDEY